MLSAAVVISALRVKIFFECSQQKHNTDRGWAAVQCNQWKYDSYRHVIVISKSGLYLVPFLNVTIYYKANCSIIWCLSRGNNLCHQHSDMHTAANVPFARIYDKITKSA